jgi:hypothetical protein
MELMTIHNYRFYFDKKATIEAYKNFSACCIEQCSCAYCKNFNESRNEIYTKEFLELLQAIGINHKQEAEVYHIKACNKSRHLYGGWFHFIGRPDRYIHKNGTPTIEKIKFGDSLEAFITDQTILVDTAFQNKPVLQLEFIVETPWLIEELI